MDHVRRIFFLFAFAFVGGAAAAAAEQPRQAPSVEGVPQGQQAKHRSELLAIAKEPNP